MSIKTALLASCLLSAGVFVPVAAYATPPVGDCPSDYQLLTRKLVSALPDAALALVAYDSVNHNGDGLVCYRAYPNGPHNGGYSGNFIDNTAAPHQ